MIRIPGAEARWAILLGAAATAACATPAPDPSSETGGARPESAPATDTARDTLSDTLRDTLRDTTRDTTRPPPATRRTPAPAPIDSQPPVVTRQEAGRDAARGRRPTRDSSAREPLVDTGKTPPE